ncbi:MAG: radical SAM protein [Desulfonatronovibrionaceae bacterium]
MRVLLIYPPCLEPRYTDLDHTYTPIGLYYLAALLMDRGFKVRILNAYAEQVDRGRLEKIIHEFRPDLAGFTVFNANRWAALEYCRVIKETSPQTVTVFGGVAATFMWEHFLSNFSQPDFIVRGEGEIPLEILAGQIQKGELTPENIPGLAWRGKGTPRANPCPDFLPDLDQLPDPAEHFTFSHVALSRGCPGKCTFCASPAFWKRKVRFHSPQYFLRQLARLREKGVTYFNVSDDTFTLKPRLVREVCQGIIEKGLDITWAAISRVDRVDEETLRLMRRAGCIQISFGVESGSEKIRGLLNKDITEPDIVRAFDLCKKACILPRAYFIYACPEEDESTMKQSRELIQKIKPLSAVFYILHLFPGTALYDRAVAEGKLENDVWLKKIEEVSWHELDPGMQKEDVLTFGKALRETFYKTLPHAARELTYETRKEEPEFGADFLSRLGLTFTHGDLSRIEEIPEKEKLARELLEKALDTAPDRRAFLGLGILQQKKRNFTAAEKVLVQGVRCFPKDPEITLALGLTYMNTGRFQEALQVLTAIENRPEAEYYISECRKKIR